GVVTRAGGRQRRGIPGRERSIRNGGEPATGQDHSRGLPSRAWIDTRSPIDLEALERCAACTAQDGNRGSGLERRRGRGSTRGYRAADEKRVHDQLDAIDKRVS